MPDIPDRDELERKLARALSRLNKAQLARLLEYMGDPPDMNKVPPEFWREAGEELAAVVVPFSERVYLDAAERMLETVTMGVDWDLVNIAASSWARDYGYNLVTGINQTSRQAISSAVDAYFQQGLTQGQLQDRLSRIYSPVRAEMIARTEVTRAAAQGERAFVQEIRKQGIEMVEVWQTRNDEVVCPICGPRNEKKRGDGWDSDNEPPAHPRCRCWINHEIVRQTDAAQSKFGTVAEVENWLSSNGINANLGGASLEQAQAIADGVRAGSEFYKGNLPVKNIRFDSSGHGRWVGKFDTYQDTLLFDPNAFDKRNTWIEEVAGIDKRIARLERKLSTYSDLTDDEIKYIKERIALYSEQKAIRRGASDTLEDIVMHEFGHAIENDLKFGSSFPDIVDFLSPSELRERGVDWSRTLSAKLDQIAAREGLKISEYATTNAEEYFAEAFLNYTKGKKDTIHPDLLDLFERILK